MVSPLRIQPFGVKWGASFRWSSVVVIHRLSMLGKMIFNSVRIITKCHNLFGVGVRMIPSGHSRAGSIPAAGKNFIKYFLI